MGRASIATTERYLAVDDDEIRAGCVVRALRNPRISLNQKGISQ